MPATPNKQTAGHTFRSFPLLQRHGETPLFAVIPRHVPAHRRAPPLLLPNRNPSGRASPATGRPTTGRGFAGREPGLTVATIKAAQKAAPVAKSDATARPDVFARLPRNAGQTHEPFPRSPETVRFSGFSQTEGEVDSAGFLIFTGNGLSC
jgi:hypothetical protein